MKQLPAPRSLPSRNGEPIGDCGPSPLLLPSTSAAALRSREKGTNVPSLEEASVTASLPQVAAEAFLAWQESRAGLESPLVPLQNVPLQNSGKVGQGWRLRLFRLCQESKTLPWWGRYPQFGRTDLKNPGAPSFTPSVAGWPTLRLTPGLPVQQDHLDQDSDMLQEGTKAWGCQGCSRYRHVLPSPLGPSGHLPLRRNMAASVPFVVAF